MTPRTIIIVVGARPQFIKAAVLARRLASGDFPDLKLDLIHTGQHYDDNMSDLFFRQLGLPQPLHHLGVGSAPAPEQIAQILERLAPILRQQPPAALVVVGDTNSTLAAAFCASQLEIPLVHVEAGERIYRRHQVPEETNRVLTDHLARLCLAATRRSCDQLLAEGIAAPRAQFTGDLHYDLFQWAADHPDFASVKPAEFALEAGQYHLATIHRVENTDDPDRLIALLEVLGKASLPVLIPLHPRSRKKLEARKFVPPGSLRLVEPLGYFDLMRLLSTCRRCITDSGGLIREAWFARRPSIVPMRGVYWPAIAEAGWSVTVGHDLDALAEAIEHFEPAGPYVDDLFGDGDAAGKILAAIEIMLNSQLDESPWHPAGAPSHFER